jgi:predicted dehydrogenase
MAALRTAVIGCGLIGSRRAHVAAEHPASALHLVVDVREDAARRLADECGCRWSLDWRPAVADPGIDVVVVSTSNDQLMPIGVAALHAGKDVLVEKPMGRDLSEATQLEHAASRSGRRLKIGFNHRYHPAVARARAVVAEAGIGPLINARARYGHGGRAGYESEWRGNPTLAGGGELTDQGVHVLDLLQCFLGMPQEVFCVTQTAFWPIAPLEDNAFALLRYPSGAVAALHTSWTQWKNLFSLEIFGRDGYLGLEGLGGSYGTETLTVGRRRPEGGAPEITQTAFPGPDESWRLEWEEFVGAMTRGTPYQGTPREGVGVMAALDGLYRSARAARPVVLEPDRPAGAPFSR